MYDRVDRYPVINQLLIKVSRLTLIEEVVVTCILLSQVSRCGLIFGLHSLVTPSLVFSHVVHGSCGETKCTCGLSCGSNSRLNVLQLLIVIIESMTGCTFITWISWPCEWVISLIRFLNVHEDMNPTQGEWDVLQTFNFSMLKKLTCSRHESCGKHI